MSPSKPPWISARVDILKRIRNEYDEAVRKENLLTTDYASQRSVVTGEGGKGIQYGILKREVESNRQLYDAMLQQLQQSSLASALRASNIQVVDPAKPPTHPYKPDVESSAGIGLLSGLVLGAAFVVMQERADRSIQDPGETQIFLNLPELGVIPADDTGTRFRLRFAGSKKVTADAVNGGKNGQGCEPLANSHLGSRVELISWQRKPSIVAESFRATLVSILFSGENGSRPRVMVVTSAGPAEGKSTVVSNLGIAIAEVNQKTLLIDADLRKPRQHDIFNLKNDKGLSELLRSKDPVSTFLEGGIIQETDIPDLYVLTSGAASSAATSLLYSNRMPELIQKLRTEFESHPDRHAAHAPDPRRPRAGPHGGSRGSGHESRQNNSRGCHRCAPALLGRRDQDARNDPERLEPQALAKRILRQLQRILLWLSPWL